MRGWHAQGQQTVSRPDTHVDTADQLLLVFGALCDATPPIEHPLCVPENRRLEKRLTSYDRGVREAAYQLGLDRGLDPETAAQLADEHMARLRGIWSAALGALAVVMP